MGEGLKRVAKRCGGLTVKSTYGKHSDQVKYGPHVEDGRTTSGLKAGDMVRVVCGKPISAKVVRVISPQLALVARIFATSGKASKPYKVHVSAIER